MKTLVYNEEPIEVFDALVELLDSHACSLEQRAKDANPFSVSIWRYIGVLLKSRQFQPRNASLEKTLQLLHEVISMNMSPTMCNY
jgi:hypothetical protein